MKINNKEINGIKRAVGEFNSWQGAAIIAYDKSLNSVSCSVFGGSSEGHYKDPDIIELVVKSSFLGRDEKTSMKEVKEILSREI